MGPAHTHRRRWLGRAGRALGRRGRILPVADSPQWRGSARGNRRNSALAIFGRAEGRRWRRRDLRGGDSTDFSRVRPRRVCDANRRLNGSMRPLLHGDVSSAARALLSAPPDHREHLCAQLIAEAELAVIHVQATGRLHPVFGNGSLMAAARRKPLADEPSFHNLQYCECFEMVIRHLIRYHLSRMRN